MEGKVIFNTVQIMEILPHRPPFLLVDRVVEFEDGHRIVGIKNVTMNEPYFEGHFPGNPVMPGVLALEAMAQTGVILAKRSTGGVAPDKTMYFVGADEVRWKKMIVPGDQLRIDMSFIKKKGPLWMIDGVVTVDGKLAVQASLRAAEG